MGFTLRIMSRAAFRAFLVFIVSAVAGCAFGYSILFRQTVRFSEIGNSLQFQFLEACRRGDIGEMSRLVNAGASATAFADNGYSEPSGPPILEAAENARPEAVKWLLDRGATWDVIVADGWTPLGAAEVKKREAEKTIEILRAARAKRRNE